MSDETTLLPCPFCGSKNVETSYKDTFSGDFRRGVYCADCCGGIYPYYDTEAEAIAAWNTRADYHGYEQAAIEAWKSIKTWNTRATHGTLTAEQVRELIAPHLHARPTFDFGRHGAVWRADFQAIADELNARAERMCRIIEYDEAPYPVCSECGAVQPDDYTVYFCWNCGAKVRDA